MAVEKVHQTTVQEDQVTIPILIMATNMPLPEASAEVAEVAEEATGKEAAEEATPVDPTKVEQPVPTTTAPTKAQAPQKQAMAQ